MIPAELEEKILRLHLVEKWPIGTIARQVGVHHTTVQRVLFGRGLLVAPFQRPSKLDPYLPLVTATLKEYPTLPSSRLYQMLLERGYQGSESHVRRVVSRIRPRKSAEAFLKLSVLPGEEGQVDWAHFGTVTVGTAVRALMAFVLVLSWSRMPFVRFFYDQRMGSFLTGHQEGFAFVGGVPRRLLYDNLKSVVLARQGNAVQFNATMLDFAKHYRYEPRPVGVRKGNEKGRVERTIRYLRTSFWGARRFSDLGELNAQVLTWCREVTTARPLPCDDTLTVGQAWEQERPRLLDLPSDNYPCHDSKDVRVGKQPYVRFDRNDYSVPHDRVRRTVTVNATPERVRVLDGSEVIAEHARCWDRRATIENPAHVAALVAQKRRARQQSGLTRLREAVPASPELLEGAAQRGHNLGSAVAGLLRLVDSWGASAVQSAVLEAVEAEAFHVAAVGQVLDRRNQATSSPPPLAMDLPEGARNITVTTHELGSYDLGGDDDHR